VVTEFRAKLERLLLWLHLVSLLNTSCKQHNWYPYTCSKNNVISSVRIVQKWRHFVICSKKSENIIGL